MRHSRRYNRRRRPVFARRRIVAWYASMSFGIFNDVTSYRWE